ncbi:MAG: GxxExxY protein, partial [Bacteroidia bacterium]
DINRPDFTIEGCMVIEFKAKPFITKEDYYQTMRYLEIVKMKLGMIVNFRQRYLKPKRIINSKVTA